jgi:hypothetical protein
VAVKSLRLWKLAPPDQLGRSEESGYEHDRSDKGRYTQMPLSNFKDLRPGYTTKDDAGDDGDDTVHSPISFYRVPNCIQSTVIQANMDLEGINVDFVFNEFIQSYVLLALKFLGLDYSDNDVSKYKYGEDFTNHHYARQMDQQELG